MANANVNHRHPQIKAKGNNWARRHLNSPIRTSTPSPKPISQPCTHPRRSLHAGVRILPEHRRPRGRRPRPHTAEQEQANLINAIAKADSGHTLAVAEINATPIGLASWKPNIAPGVGEITLNAVHPDHGGQGIGTALYDPSLPRRS